MLFLSEGFFIFFGLHITHNLTYFEEIENQKMKAIPEIMVIGRRFDLPLFTLSSGKNSM